MKQKAIQILLALFPALLFAQEKAVQKLINGKPCDTCIVKYNLSYSNVLPYVFIGATPNPERLYREYRAFKESIPDQPFEQNIFLITDSILNVVFLTGEDENADRSKSFFKWDENYDYKEIEISIEKNKKQYGGWQTLSNLDSIKDYRISRIRYSEKTQGYIVAKWKSSHQTGELHFMYNDVVEITLRRKKSKEILRKLIIRRQLDRPVHFFYWQSEITSSNVKKVIHDFLDMPLRKVNFLRGDSAARFELNQGNIGVLFFKWLETGEEIEYSFTGTGDWQSIQRLKHSLSEGAFLLLDQEDIPPGKTQSLYLRYKGQPGSIHKIEIQGVSNIGQTSFFKVTAGFMLALLLFAGWYLLKRRLHKKQIAALNRKNKDIETRLSLLSGQLNPHFLFNSLHAIQGTINSNNIGEANNYIGDIARFMRNSMDYSKREFVSLAEELYLEADYLQLEQRRKYFTFDLVIGKEVNASQIDFPPLLLQPVLENSVRHAFGKHTKPVLHIQVSGSNRDLVVSITDNGEGWNMKGRAEGHGLGLVRKRIELINEKMQHMRICMNIRSVQDEGTITTFTFENWLI
ncbi:sensor histidine kinase [Filimonas effusa]|uniref:Signal transduction histidine kinase internal region domain-containing protein n=1 Tax=Filimonas effusa TaxID=2508721 RepID=A0A4Q1D150_9BACT|nr:histidine kinase [Filimonas effusa]RXK80811.1 hypothetical protein ESB13_21880 [Filimonas effusa]